MSSLCSSCRRRLWLVVPFHNGPSSRATRQYSQSVDTILDPSTRDGLSRVLDPALRDQARRRYNPRSSASRSKPGLQRNNDRRTPKFLDLNGGAVEPVVDLGEEGKSSSSSLVDRLKTTKLQPPDPYPRLLRDGNLDLAWKVFRTQAKKRFKAQAGEIENYDDLERKLQDLFAASRTAWWRYMRDQYTTAPPAGPSLLELDDYLKEHPQLDGKLLPLHVFHLASLSAMYNPPNQAPLQSDPQQRLHRSLMDYWATWVKENSVLASRDGSSPYSFIDKTAAVPPSEQQTTSIVSTGEYLVSLNPEFSTSPGDLPIVNLALCLLAVMRKAMRASPLLPEFEKYIPFVEDMDAVLAASDMQAYRPQLQHALTRTGMNERTVATVLSHLRGPVVSVKAPVLVVKASEMSVQELAAQVRASLARYVERQNLDRAEQGWEAVRARLNEMAASMSATDKQAPELLSIYEEFLVAFRSLRRADHTQEVWNHMITFGCVPKVRTWNVMLKGCHVGKEVDAMEAVWARMIRAGVKPDSHSWAIRIHGLFQFRKLREGYNALTEMTETSMRAKRGAGTIADDVPQPNTVILNSALSGAARLGTEPVRKLLTWARGHKIPFDVITYNVLINVALNTGQKEDARKIMQRMASEGIAPNSATFTVLLHSMFKDGFLQDIPVQDQEQHAMAFIRSLEQDGLSLDVRGYALLLDRLLKECNNLPAAKRVLEHMIARRVEPTAHMYTILMTHYFSLDPPDIDAVEALWDRIRSRQSYAVDVIFYDRMLEGFARADRATKMMYFLQRMGQEGKRPGWMALVEVLQCLLRRGDVVKAKELIKDVNMSEGNLKAGVRGRKGCENFWALARKVGGPEEGIHVHNSA